MDDLIKKSVIILCKDINSRGSGFVVSSDGYIATNNHVISSKQIISNNISVVFDDGTICESKIVCSNSDKDFALLKVDKGGLDYFELGDYSTIEEFSDVFFVGQGLDVPKISIHKGWVSRKIETENMKILQIDGPINQGNSGGPVIDKNGNVVAIVTKTEAIFDSDLIGLLDVLPNLQGDIVMFGIRLPETLRRIIYFLNRNRFVGLGYSISIEYLKSEYLKLKPQ